MHSMVEYRDKLNAMGHKGHIHPHYDAFVRGELQDIITRALEKGEHAQVKIENDYIKAHYNFILENEAILVLNHDKNGIKNYVGGNTLMEIGFAYVNNKKIFLLNPIPEMSYTDEIRAVDPIILNGDLSLIN